jgi:hypothetical protein
LRLPYFLDTQLTDGDEVSLTWRLCLTSQEDSLVVISVRSLVNPRAILLLEGLSKLKIPNDLFGIKTATFWLIALQLKQLLYCVSLPSRRLCPNHQPWSWNTLLTHQISFLVTPASSYHEEESNGKLIASVKRVCAPTEI